MSVEIRKYDLKRKFGMQKLYLTIYRGYSISKDGKKKLHQSQKFLDLEIYSKPVNDHQIHHNEEVWKIAEEVRADTYLRIKLSHNKMYQLKVPTPSLVAPSLISDYF